MSVKLPQELRASERMRSARWPRPCRSGNVNILYFVKEHRGDSEWISHQRNKRKRKEKKKKRENNENLTCCSVSSSCSSLSCMLLTFSSGNFCISTTCSTSCSYKLSLAAMERKGLRYREVRMSTPLLWEWASSVRWWQCTWKVFCFRNLEVWSFWVRASPVPKCNHGQKKNHHLKEKWQKKQCTCVVDTVDQALQGVGKGRDGANEKIKSEHFFQACRGLLHPVVIGNVQCLADVSKRTLMKPNAEIIKSKHLQIQHSRTQN